MAKWDHEDLKDKSEQQYKRYAAQKIVDTQPSLPNQTIVQNDSNLLRIQRQRVIIDELMQENAKLRAALLLIREHKMPYPGFSMDQGSNGVRDHFIGIAARALEGLNG